MVDRDDYAIMHLESLKEDQGIRLMHTDFATATQRLVEEGKAFDLILIDLGVSSPQLDQGERGFSFYTMVRSTCAWTDEVAKRLPTW